jgi:SAM-dependent methyltransferase
MKVYLWSYKVEHVSCGLCSSDTPVFLTRVPDIKYGTQNVFCLVYCGFCGLVYVNPRPTFLEMQGYYDATYGPHSAAYTDVPKRERSNDQYHRGHMMQFLHGLPEVFSAGRLLDVGCGDGYWLYLMQKLGWKPTGVEISPQAVRFANEKYDLDIKVGNLIDQEFPDGYFDVVTFWHSLEHMHDPKAMIKEAYRILRAGGVVVAKVPNIDTVLFRVFGRYYSMIQAPYHLYHFSPLTLGRLLAESGFNVYRTTYSPGIDGIALSIKNWWLSFRGVSLQKTGKYTSPYSAQRNTDRGSIAWLKRKVVLPMMKPVGRFLASVCQGDVFSMYASKR